MLKYFVQTTEALITAALLIGLIISYACAHHGRAGKLIIWIMTGAGLVCSGVMAYMKNATSHIDTSMWNYRMFITAIIALVLFFVFTALRKLINKIKPLKLGDWLPPVCLGVISMAMTVYAASDVWAYPYNILMVEKTVVSTTFILKCVGILFGLILTCVAGLAAGKGLERLGHGAGLIILSLALTINAVRQACGIVSIMVTKHMILRTASYYHTCFEIVKFTSNNSNVFVYGVLAVTLSIPAILWVKSFLQKEPYSNPAQHRKIRRKWRTARRWATLAVSCVVMTLVSMTSIKAYTQREVELSPIEDSVVRDGKVYVSFEQVADGHLHRFGYTTPGGVQVRFIVIKKPDSSSYGVGMDACDICGETGYYEKDGQVVCKLCDVVMNISTIGFKGGCNPKIVDYTIENGNIAVYCESLEQYEKDFK